MRSVVSVVVAAAIGLVLVTAVPNAQRASAALACAGATADDFYAYQFVYFADAQSVRPPSSGIYASNLQFSSPRGEVQRLYYKNRQLLLRAFLARHAPKHAKAKKVGYLKSDGPVEVLGPRVARAPVVYVLDTGPVRMMLSVVCDQSTRKVPASWKVPLDDFCRALSASPHAQKCSEALLRRARKGLPRSTVPTTVPTTSPPTTIPPITVPTTTPAPDGYCPYVGLPCNANPTHDPDCVCG